MAETGSVLLAAGEAVSFNFDPAAGVTGLLVEPARVRALVENGRIVRAPGGQVIVSAQAHNEMAAGVIRNTGEIAANGITTDGGRVMLGASESVEQGGLVDASSATGKGGSVDITAPTIALLDASSLLATGELGGGRIHVGGGWQGAGPLPQARRVTQAANSLIDASAIRLGRGGEVVLWSDVRDILSLTQAVGVIRARGGELGGDGGRVETSGYVLQVSGISVDTLSPKGRTGDWLLDPVNITIAASGGNLTPDQLRVGLLHQLGDRVAQSEQPHPDGRQQHHNQLHHQDGRSVDAERRGRDQPWREHRHRRRPDLQRGRQPDRGRQPGFHRMDCHQLRLARLMGAAHRPLRRPFRYVPRHRWHRSSRRFRW
jgi:hypothetical protein